MICVCARVFLHICMYSADIYKWLPKQKHAYLIMYTLWSHYLMLHVYIYILCMYMFGFQVKNLKGTSISYLEESLEKEDQTLGRLESWVNHGEPKIASLSLVRQGFRYTEGGGWGEPGGTKWNQVEDMFGWPQLLSRHTSQCLKQPWQRTNMNTVCPTRTL